MPPDDQRYSSQHRGGGAQDNNKQAAFELQVLIHEKLLKAGLEIPPYDLVLLIGAGNYGRVFLAKDLNHNRYVAIKVIDADAVDYVDAPHNMREQTMIDFQHEVEVLSVLKERKVPNVNTIYDVFVVYDQLWIVTEFCAGGSVHTLMHAQEDKLKEKYIITIIREVVKGVVAIHEAGIIHRDLKAANVMVTEYGGVQIIDFGVAATIESWADKRATFIGTLNWMAPEFHKKDPSSIQYGTEVDIWAIGCTIYEMVTGRPPYAKARDKRWLGNELKRNPPRLTPSDEVSEELCAFIEFILQPAPEKRPTAKQLLDHPYLKGTEETYKTGDLVDLVIDFNKWEYEGNSRQSLMIPMTTDLDTQRPRELADVDTSWRFSMANSADLDLSAFATAHESLDSGETTAKPAGFRRAPSVRVDTQHDFSSPFSGPYDLNNFAMAPEMDSPYQSVRESHLGSQDSTTKIAGSKTVNIDQRAAKRGENQLASIFNENRRPYTYGKDSGDEFDLIQSKSDLPLRNNAATSDVRPKEVFAPDPSKPRLLVPGSIPDIGSINLGTIKQNRMLKSGAGVGQSDSSGDENPRSNKPKRSTMAWEPEWNVMPSSEEPTPLHDPFAQPTFGNTASSSGNLAPPQRPAIHQANSAPGDIPTTGNLMGGARASTTSAIFDMDAAWGDDLPTSNHIDFTFPTPSMQQQHAAMGESYHSIQPEHHQQMYTEPGQNDSKASLDVYSGRTSHEMSQIETDIESDLMPKALRQASPRATPSASPPNTGSVDRYTFNPEEMIGLHSPINTEVQPLQLGIPDTPPLPPRAEAMEDGAPAEVMEAELVRLLEEYNQEMQLYQQESEALMASEAAEEDDDLDEDEEDTYDDEDDVDG